MIVFSAILPHSPLLIPGIGKENTTKLKQTIEALHEIEGDFYSTQPDSVIIISPHGNINQNSFLINFSPKYWGDFSEFGEMSLKPIYYGDNALSYKIKERVETTYPLQLTTDEKLNYSFASSLEFISAHKKDIKIVPISSSNLSLEEHFNFGKALIDELRQSEKRIAVIASVETSNKLSKKSPAGYATSAKKFDQKIVDAIKNKDTEFLLSLTEKDITKNGAEEIKAILIFLGIFADINYQPELLSYESPFGVGHLVMEMKL